MPTRTKNGPVTLLIALLALVCACSDSNNNDNNNAADEYLAIGQASVELPPEAGSPFLLTTVSFDVGSVGYKQEEYFLSGTATAFNNVNELGPDGRWQVEPGATAAYKTRIVIYSPISPAAFSGTVFVEWLNVSAGFETQPSWSAGHTEILRAGHAWIGVSAQLVGIEGSPDALLPLDLKTVEPERYASLAHPGDSYSYDIFSQVARALREPGDIDMLRGLGARRYIALGQSQGASRLLTYINAIHPLYNAYDGYLVHSRYQGSAQLAGAPETAINTPQEVIIRTDLNVPVLNLQTETDVIGLGAIASRQSDSRKFRLWEVAGGSHSDYYVNVSGRADKGVDPEFALVVEETSVLGFINCEKPMNAGPTHWVVNAALSALHNWVLNGALPARADRLDTQDDSKQFRKDDFGNTTGGIRTPYLDAPAALLSGDVNEGEQFCNLFGTTQLFDAATMASLYVDKAGYIQAVAKATDEAVSKGFLLEIDGERIKAAAALQWNTLDN
jgi:hypothetical protein